LKANVLTHFGLTNLNPGIIPCYQGSDCGNTSQKAFDLIQYLESNDFLKGAGYIGDDRNPRYLQPKKQIKRICPQ